MIQRLVRLSLSSEIKNYSWLNFRGFVPTTSDHWWWTSASWHPRHSRSSWIHGNAWSVYEMRRRFHHLLLDLRPSQLPRSFRVSKAHRTGETNWRHSTGACRQQTRSSVSTKSFVGRRKSSCHAVWMSVLWDFCGFAVQCRRSFLHFGARNSKKRSSKSNWKLSRMFWLRFKLNFWTFRRWTATQAQRRFDRRAATSAAVSGFVSGRFLHSSSNGGDQTEFISLQKLMESFYPQHNLSITVS